MPYRLLALAGIVAAGLVALMGSFGLHASPSRPTLPLPPNLPDTTAEQTLDRAIAAMSPERLGCLETKLWQKVTLPNQTYVATGRYLMGPQHRFRLEMHTKQDSVAATRLVISDGATLWEANRVGSGDWSSVSKVKLAPVLAVLDGAGPPARLRAEFLEGPRFGGVASLLRNLRERMNWVKIEKVSRGGKVRLRLTGVWTAAVASSLRSGPAWPACLPEQFRLELDPLTLWPYRVEWWGPIADGAADTLLAQLEFRNPVVHPTLSSERCAKEFTFQPGDAFVEDQTADVLAEYAGRLR